MHFKCYSDVSYLIKRDLINSCIISNSTVFLKNPKLLQKSFEFYNNASNHNKLYLHLVTRLDTIQVKDFSEKQQFTLLYIFRVSEPGLQISGSIHTNTPTDGNEDFTQSWKVG